MMAHELKNKYMHKCLKIIVHFDFMLTFSTMEHVLYITICG